MAEPFLETLWGPILLAAIAADLNFWIYASIGTNEGDAVGIAFFFLFAAYCFGHPRARRSVAMVVAGAGAVVAGGLMILRETDTFDRGYLPPYALLVASVLAGHLIARLLRRQKEGT